MRKTPTALSSALALLNIAGIAFALAMPTGCRDRAASSTRVEVEAAAKEAEAANLVVDAGPARELPSAPADVAAPPADARKLASGVALKVLKAGIGTEHPGPDDCVRVHFTGWKRDGAFLSSTRTFDDPEMQCLRRMMPGLADAIRAMVAGEAARVWVPAKLGFVADPSEPHEAPPADDLTYDVEILEVRRAPPVPSDLKAPPKSAIRTPSGLAYRVLKKGAGGDRPKLSSRVRIEFTGWSADGVLVKSTAMGGRPAELSMADVIPGWREGLQTMTAGEKTRFWIPSSLGFGDKPRRGGVAGNLVYDIELLSFQ